MTQEPKKQAFELISNLQPAGDQPQAIEQLVAKLQTSDGDSKHILRGVTGSGKTFTIANTIAQVGKPTLVLVHNKTLAYQVYQELRALFPHNSVEYFISYFDYYQPESYLPTTDTYIEKDSRTNKSIERMRLRTTAALLSRNDVIVVSSISCIYGLGNPEDWLAMACSMVIGERFNRVDLFSRLVEMQYTRNDAMPLESGHFRVRGNVVDIVPGYEDKKYIRIRYQGNQVQSISECEILTDNCISMLDRYVIFPARHYVLPSQRIGVVCERIKQNLEEHAATLGPLERSRLMQRTMYDIEMIQQSGYCNGIENYSIYFDERPAERPPYCLLDFFPKDFLMVIDESHQSIPQASAMYHGDRMRKKNLVEHGFRLPSAYGNRPLMFSEFETYLKNVIFVSATPGTYEFTQTDSIIEQVVRPTGLVDPDIIVRPTDGQVNDVIIEIQKEIASGGRVLITTLTKRMAEDLAKHLMLAGISARYMHSEIKSLERSVIITQLRKGQYNVLVGVNLLREGLDIPEVTLVAILDADKEGFLRNDRSLIQTIGRAARNAAGRVIMYANQMTGSMRRAIDETDRRRAIQKQHNSDNSITPRTIQKPIEEVDELISASATLRLLPPQERAQKIEQLKSQMMLAAEQMDFERAIELRDCIKVLEDESN